MHFRITILVLAICLSLVIHRSESGQQPGEKPKDQPAPPVPPEAALINKLIKQLGSPKFTERNSAEKQLESIGEPALESLRNAVKSSDDLETRRRVEQLADRVEMTMLAKLVKDGVQQHQKKDYKKAAEYFDAAIKKGEARFLPKDGRAPPAEIPFLIEVFLHSARTSKEMGDHEKAAKGYQRASYFTSYNFDKRLEVDREWFEMVDGLVSGWKNVVKAKTDNDPTLKKLVSKHPLVHLHSRRYAGGGYLQSAYSFIYESTEKHRNDVQLLFDNGLRDKAFGVNMLGGQMNRLADLGIVDFEKNFDPVKIETDGKIQWQADDKIKATEGHVYLEHVNDSRGNNFFVVFKVVAVEEDSKYVAFVWRRLPGGKTVKDK